MQRFIKILKITSGVIVILFVASTVAIYFLSDARLKRKYALPKPVKVKILKDSLTLARGKHLSVVTNCVLCHGNDLGGKVYYEGILGTIAGPNLTDLDKTQKAYTNEDWIRSIRHGVRRDSTSLLVMPSEVFVKLSIPDLSALISYIKQVPSVSRNIPETKLHFLGRTLLALGKLPILVASKTDHAAPIKLRNPMDTLELGNYMTEVYSCKGCHGTNLSGGRKMGVPGAPPSTNLTNTGTGSWAKVDFIRILRSGIKHDGKQMHDIMPWQNAGQLTDQEMNAIWVYLKSIPAVPTGKR